MAAGGDRRRICRTQALCLAGAAAAKSAVRLMHRIGDMAEARIRKACGSDKAAIAEMMASLWPDGTLAEFAEEAAAIIETGMYGTMAAVILLAVDECGSPLGFLHVGLRSHADGCDPAHPVGFVEGWFVREKARRQGIGRALVRAAEDWSRSMDCVEMASDALVDSAESLRAHGSAGFEVVDRCVHFRKRL